MPSHEKRTKTILIRIAESEHAQWKQRACQDETTVSDLIRTTMQRSAPRSTPKGDECRRSRTPSD